MESRHICMLILALTTAAASAIGDEWHPCVEVKRDLRIPCSCAITVSGLNKTTLALRVNCDHMILVDDGLSSLAGQPIISFSQKHCGHQNLPSRLIGVLPETIESLDLSGNAIDHLMDGQLKSRASLRELRLADNALGDNLNPIFSSNEFHQLSGLRLLDLSSNGLRGIEEGIFKGNAELQELYLDGNDFVEPPVQSLKGPRALRVISLAGNNIGSISQGAFSTLGETLLNLDLSNNGLSHMEDDALRGMSSLLILNISFNDISRLNSDVLRGAYNLQQLDVSSNFLKDFPTKAFIYQNELKFLNISNNLITELEHMHVANLQELQILDLSRNSISRLGVKTFSVLTSIEQLDLSNNALRTIEESCFDGLANLKWLSLQDNNILQVPSTALARLPSLTHLNLRYNRISALLSDNFKTSAAHLTTFNLANNLVYDLPARFFLQFDRLSSIELPNNLISAVDQQSFAGVEDTLTNLDLSFNRLSSVGELTLRNLLSLNLAGNQLRKIVPDTFRHLGRLQHLNISNNPLQEGFPPILPRSLASLDVTRTGLQVLPSILLANLEGLESISLSGNRLRRLFKNTFKRLRNLTHVDLSFNQIAEMENETFTGLASLYKLSLRNNRLKAFRGECFNTGTGLEILDLSENGLEYISPTAFLIHPRLRQIDLSENRLAVFPSESIITLQFLERLDLSNNLLSVIGEFAFSQVARLRALDLSGNRIESVGELAFHNSSQLQQLDLSGNSLENLSERMMEGVLWMEKLDLHDNSLAALPATIFDASRIRSLQSIDLSGNRFTEIPVQSLRRQASNLLELKMARNRLTQIFSQDIINTVKSLDVSGNPLSERAVGAIIGEAKVMRSLNIASCGIRRLVKLEAPFLKRLNLSANQLEHIEPFALERTTMLEELDVSGNQLEALESIKSASSSFATLRALDVSRNGMKIINESSLASFSNLRRLSMSDLDNCIRIEKNAFKPLSRLRKLQAHHYPRLGYFDVQGIIKGMSNLEALDIEIKDLNVGNDQISMRDHPRLKSLTVRGDRLKNVLSNLLVGVRSTEFSLGLKNSSIDAIPMTLLLPVPRSTRVELDVSGSKFDKVPSQWISNAEERGSVVRIKGLDITTKCDCEARNLRRWYVGLATRADNSIRCASPEWLKGQSLRELDEEQLSCETTKSTGSFRTASTPTTASTTRRSTISEPEIIWTVAPTTAQDRRNNKDGNGELPMPVSPNMASSTDDTLVIAIVSGIVALIAIIVIIICICRLRLSDQVDEACIQNAMASSIHEASMLHPSAYGAKMSQDLYLSTFNGSTLGHSNNGTLLNPASMSATPVPMLPYSLPMMPAHSGAQPIYGYYDNSPIPIYLTAPSESKADR